MWIVNGLDLIMAEGDYGVALPCELHDVVMSQDDSVKFTIKYRKNGEVKVSKDYNHIENNIVNLSLTKEESDRLPIGIYVYSLDWYQNGVFMCNAVLDAEFKVVDKA